jgi:hypothetical protein
MSHPEKCDRCGAEVTHGLPKPGLTSFFGKVTRDTWRIRFNYLRMNSWENAVTASDVIASSTWSEVTLCDSCWGDVLSFVNKKIERKP